MFNRKKNSNKALKKEQARALEKAIREIEKSGNLTEVTALIKSIPYSRKTLASAKKLFTTYEKNYEKIVKEIRAKEKETSKKEVDNALKYFDSLESENVRKLVDRDMPNIVMDYLTNVKKEYSHNKYLVSAITQIEADKLSRTNYSTDEKARLDFLNTAVAILNNTRDKLSQLQSQNSIEVKAEISQLNALFTNPQMSVRDESTDLFRNATHINVPLEKFDDPLEASVSIPIHYFRNISFLGAGAFGETTRVEFIGDVADSRGLQHFRDEYCTAIYDPVAKKDRYWFVLKTLTNHSQQNEFIYEQDLTKQLSRAVDAKNAPYYYGNGATLTVRDIDHPNQVHKELMIISRLEAYGFDPAKDQPESKDALEFLQLAAKVDFSAKPTSTADKMSHHSKTAGYGLLVAEIVADGMRHSLDAMHTKANMLHLDAALRNCFVRAIDMQAPDKHYTGVMGDLGYALTMHNGSANENRIEKPVSIVDKNRTMPNAIATPLSDWYAHRIAILEATATNLQLTFPKIRGPIDDALIKLVNSKDANANASMIKEYLYNLFVESSGDGQRKKTAQILACSYEAYLINPPVFTTVADMQIINREFDLSLLTTGHNNFFILNLASALDTYQSDNDKEYLMLSLQQMVNTTLPISFPSIKNEISAVLNNMSAENINKLVSIVNQLKIDHKVPDVATRLDNIEDLKSVKDESNANRFRSRKEFAPPAYEPRPIPATNEMAANESAENNTVNTSPEYAPPPIANGIAANESAENNVDAAYGRPPGFSAGIENEVNVENSIEDNAVNNVPSEYEAIPPAADLIAANKAPENNVNALYGRPPGFSAGVETNTRNDPSHYEAIIPPENAATENNTIDASPLSEELTFPSKEKGYDNIDQFSTLVNRTRADAGAPPYIDPTYAPFKGPNATPLSGVEQLALANKAMEERTRREASAKIAAQKAMASNFKNVLDDKPAGFTTPKAILRALKQNERLASRQEFKRVMLTADASANKTFTNIDRETKRLINVYDAAINNQENIVNYLEKIKNNPLLADNETINWKNTRGRLKAADIFISNRDARAASATQLLANKKLADAQKTLEILNHAKENVIGVKNLINDIKIDHNNEMIHLENAVDAFIDHIQTFNENTFDERLKSELVSFAENTRNYGKTALEKLNGGELNQKATEMLDALTRATSSTDMMTTLRKYREETPKSRPTLRDIVTLKTITQVSLRGLANKMLVAFTQAEALKAKGIAPAARLSRGPAPFHIEKPPVAVAAKVPPVAPAANAAPPIAPKVPEPVAEFEIKPVTHEMLFSSLIDLMQDLIESMKHIVSEIEETKKHSESLKNERTDEAPAASAEVNELRSPHPDRRP